MDRLKSILASGIFAFIIALIVYIINDGLGNDFSTCFEISALLFFNIFIGFLAYFTVSDYFGARWSSIEIPEDIKVVKLKIDFSALASETAKNLIIQEILYDKMENDSQKESEFALSRLRSPLDSEAVIRIEIVHLETADLRSASSDSNIVFYFHGLTDNPKKVRQTTVSLALLGYIIIVCDLSTLKVDIDENEVTEFELSSWASENSKILKKAAAVEKILKMFDEEVFKELDDTFKVHLVGESMGGLIAVRNYMNFYERPWLGKVVLISCFSNFTKIFPKWTVPLTKTWLIKWNYRIRGFKLHPHKRLNEELSPSILLKRHREEWSKKHKRNGWENYAKRRFLLIHSKSDGVVVPENFYENKSTLGLTDGNAILFDNGGHTQIWNELGILGLIDGFIQNSV